MATEDLFESDLSSQTPDIYQGVIIWPSLQNEDVIISLLKGVSKEAPGMENVRNLRQTPELMPVIEHLGTSPTRLQLWLEARSLILPPNESDPEIELAFLRKVRKYMTTESYPKML